MVMENTKKSTFHPCNAELFLPPHRLSLFIICGVLNGIWVQTRCVHNGEIL